MLSKCILRIALCRDRQVGEPERSEMRSAWNCGLRRVGRGTLAGEERVHRRSEIYSELQVLVSMVLQYVRAVRFGLSSGNHQIVGPVPHQRFRGIDPSTIPYPPPELIVVPARHTEVIREARQCGVEDVVHERVVRVRPRTLNVHAARVSGAMFVVVMRLIEETRRPECFVQIFPPVDILFAWGHDHVCPALATTTLSHAASSNHSVRTQSHNIRDLIRIDEFYFRKRVCAECARSCLQASRT